MMIKLWKCSSLLPAILCLAVCLGFAPTVSAEDKGKAEVGHGEVDLSHGHSSKMLNNPMEFRADGALFSLIVFLLLLATLWAVAWKPISEGLAKRETLIASSIAEAKKASDDAAAMLREYQVKLDAAQGQAQEMLAQARKDAESSGQRILADAQAEAGRQRERAIADIESAKQSALVELASQSTEIAFGLARKVVGRELKADDHQKLVQEALKQMPSRN